MLAAPPGAHESQVLPIFFEHTVIGDPGPLPATARGRTLVLDMAPQREEHLQPETPEPLEPGTLGQCPENLGWQVLVPAAHARVQRGYDSQKGTGTSRQRFSPAAAVGVAGGLRSPGRDGQASRRRARPVRGPRWHAAPGHGRAGGVRGSAATALSGFGLALLIAAVDVIVCCST